MAQIEVEVIDSKDYKKFIKLLPKGYMEMISKHINYAIKERMIRLILEGNTDNYGIIDYAIKLAEEEQEKKRLQNQKIKLITSSASK